MKGGGTSKIEHKLRNWEKKYGYIRLSQAEQAFFSLMKGKRFTLKFLGKELLERKIDSQGRIYVSTGPLRELKAGDVLVFYRDEKGNYRVEKK